MRTIEKDVETWVHGNCYVAALALHRATGWELGGLTAVRHAGRNAQMAHAWVVDPEGQVWDAGGRHDLDEIRAEFITDLEKSITHETARFESFGTEAGYMSRHLDLAGDWADECQKWFDGAMDKAEAMVRDILIPRYPEISRAAEEHRLATDPWMADSADRNRENVPEPV